MNCHPNIKSFCFAINLLLFVLPAFCQQKSQVVEVVSFYKNSLTVQVGTGFLLNDDGIITTCYHVIEGAERIEIIFENSAGIQILLSNVRITGISLEYDLAQLYCPDIPKLGLHLEPHTGKFETGRIQLWGYPKNIDKFLMPGDVIKEDYTKSENIRSSSGDAIFALAKIDLLPLVIPDVENGLSGGAVVQNGKVIGIFQGSFENGGSICWAIPVKYLKEIKPNKDQNLPISVVTTARLQLINKDFHEIVKSFKIMSATSLALIGTLKEMIAEYQKYGAMLDEAEIRGKGLLESIEIFNTMITRFKSEKNVQPLSHLNASLPLFKKIGSDFSSWEELYVEPLLDKGLPIIKSIAQTFNENKQTPLSIDKISKLRKDMNDFILMANALNNFYAELNIYNNNLSTSRIKLEEARKNLAAYPGAQTEAIFFDGIKVCLENLGAFVKRCDRKSLNIFVELPPVCLDLMVKMFYR